jgi:hypothetical protein
VVEQAPVEATKSSGKERGKFPPPCSPSPRLLLLLAEFPPVCSSLPLSLHTEAQVAMVPVDRARDPSLVGFWSDEGETSATFRRTTLCGEELSLLSTAVSS